MIYDFLSKISYNWSLAKTNVHWTKKLGPQDWMTITTKTWKDLLEWMSNEPWIIMPDTIGYHSTPYWVGYLVNGRSTIML